MPPGFARLGRNSRNIRVKGRPPWYLRGIISPLVLSLGALTTVQPSLALPGDNRQPITIRTDEAIRDETEGTTVYRGDVEIVQGSLVINADEVTLTQSRSASAPGEGLPLDPLAGSNVMLIEARGTPARMRQLPKVGGELIHARARVIEYFQPGDDPPALRGAAAPGAHEDGGGAHGLPDRPAGDHGPGEPGDGAAGADGDSAGAAEREPMSKGVEACPSGNAGYRAGRLCALIRMRTGANTTSSAAFYAPGA